MALSLSDRWIISRLQQTEQQVSKAIEEYRFDHASQALYEFTWNEYCDWYLELTKPVLNSPESSDSLKRGARRTLLRVLETLLRLAHPMMPYITEEIWQTVAPMTGKQGDTIMLQSYPMADDNKLDSQAIEDIEWVKGVVVGVRNIKGEMNIPPGKKVPALLRNGDGQDKRKWQEHAALLIAMARLESIEWIGQDEPPMSAVQLVDNMEVHVPMAGLIDREAESERLHKEMDKLAKEIRRVSGKLNNEKFVSKAPEDVVAKERAKLAEAESAHTKLKEQLDKLSAM
ncbi:MAG: hypothetical protein CSA52_02145 [Gammaproteobacteria bacterium]|nr:MAG: hypothetical protein CSA52_02145 [Gammaproteobacteria bacterium]